LIDLNCACRSTISSSNSSRLACRSKGHTPSVHKYQNTRHAMYLKFFLKLSMVGECK
jgi:hypothetical protein